MLNSVLELQNDLAEPSNALNIPPCIAHNQKTISAVIHSHFQGNVFWIGGFVLLVKPIEKNTIWLPD